MNRNISSALALGTVTAAAAVAALAIASGNAYADDITIDRTPFVSARTRAEVVNELMSQSDIARTAGTEWSMQLNTPARVKSAYTSDQAKAEYKASRQYVNALNAEDSGSAYFLKERVPANATASMGGPAR